MLLGDVSSPQSLPGELAKRALTLRFCTLRSSLASSLFAVVANLFKFFTCHRQSTCVPPAVRPEFGETTPATFSFPEFQDPTGGRCAGSGHMFDCGGLCLPGQKVFFIHRNGLERCYLRVVLSSFPPALCSGLPVVALGFELSLQTERDRSVS